MCMIYEHPKEVDPEMQKITSKDLSNFIFPKGLSKIYCFKENESGDIIEYACLDSDLKRVIVLKNLAEQQYDVYYSDATHKNYSKMVDFLSSLSWRDAYLNGKPFEIKKAKLCWQAYSPQSVTPSSLKEIISNIELKMRNK